MSPSEVARWLARARWRAGPGVAPALLAARVAAARDALGAGAAPIRAGRRKTLFALALAGPAPDHLLKAERHDTVSIGRRLGRGEAAAQLARAAAAAARGVATPLPLGAGTVRRGALLEASLLLVPIVPGAVDLGQLVARGEPAGARRRELAAAFGALVRTLHDAGVDQDDLAPNNFLWREAPEPRLLAIDFERARIRRRVPEARRALALARLDRHLAGAGSADRLRFLRGYAGGEAHRWWRLVATAQGPLAARDFAHLLRTGTRASRRFTPIAAAGLTGWARRAGPLGEALAAGAEPHAARERLWSTPLGVLSEGDRARAWAAALVLAQRGAAPPPVALLCREGDCRLVAERAPGAQPLAAAPPARARAALPGLLDRLLAFGFEPTGLAPGAVVVAPNPGGGWRAELLDPRGLRPGRGGPVPPGGARGWAARVLRGAG